VNKKDNEFDKLREICMAFDLRESIVGKGIRSIEPFGCGHINDTFLIEYNKSPERHVLQRINHNVFKKPFEVMENIIMVTEHLKKKFESTEHGSNKEYIGVIFTKDGESCYMDHEGNYWRLRPHIEHVFALDRVDNSEQMYYAGKAYGNFLNDLSDFDASRLNETIIDFHNTPKRFLSLAKTVEEDPYNRCREVEREIDYIFEREKDCTVLMDMYSAGEIPLRVTHNDTKINNVLFDIESKEGVCIIDLDTLMPGLLAYDFGDSLRSGANTADEDEPNTSKVHFDVERFRRYAGGYLEENCNITENDKKMLAFSAKLMCLEQAIRFLEDYLKKDAYYKVSRPQQNIDRARTQLKLVYEIEANMDRMNEIILDTY